MIGHSATTYHFKRISGHVNLPRFILLGMRLILTLEALEAVSLAIPLLLQCFVQSTESLRNTPHRHKAHPGSCRVITGICIDLPPPCLRRYTSMQSLLSSHCLTCSHRFRWAASANRSVARQAIPWALRTWSGAYLQFCASPSLCNVPLRARWRVVLKWWPYISW